MSRRATSRSLNGVIAGPAIVGTSMVRALNPTEVHSDAKA
jgi:hypothetical protein